MSLGDDPSSVRLRRDGVKLDPVVSRGHQRARVSAVRPSVGVFVRRVLRCCIQHKAIRAS